MLYALSVGLVPHVALPLPAVNHGGLSMKPIIRHVRSVDVLMRYDGWGDDDGYSGGRYGGGGGRTGYGRDGNNNRGGGRYDDRGGRRYNDGGGGRYDGRGGGSGRYSGGGGRNYNQGYGASYERAPGDVGEVDVSRVESLIAERAELRGKRDYDGADAVRDQLRNEHGVELYDRDMQWAVAADRRGGGRYGGDAYGGQSNGRGLSQDSYVREAGDTAPVDVERVEQLLAERSELRRARDFDGADRIRDELKGALCNNSLSNGFMFMLDTHASAHSPLFPPVPSARRHGCYGQRQGGRLVCGPWCLCKRWLRTLGLPST